MCSALMKNWVSKRVLIVDDEPFNLSSMRILLKLSLKKMNIDDTMLDAYIDQASNGSEAVEFVRK